jgi:HAD superfamily hydrolase (TIGR01509 family)
MPARTAPEPRHEVQRSSRPRASAPLDANSSFPEVFLDFSGTLVYPLGDRFAPFREALLGLGFTLEPAALERAQLRVNEARGTFRESYLGKPHGFWDEYQSSILDELGMPHVSTTTAVRHLHEAFASPRWHPPYPETASVLDDLRRRGVRMHVVSNYTELLPEILASLGWSGRFATITYSQEAGIEKPDRGFFELALKRAGCAAEAAVIVGDTWSADILGARGAGIRAIWLDRKRRAPHRAGPRIEALTGLIPLLVASQSDRSGA